MESGENASTTGRCSIKVLAARAVPDRCPTCLWLHTWLLSLSFPLLCTLLALCGPERQERNESGGPDGSLKAGPQVGHRRGLHMPRHFDGRHGLGHLLVRHKMMSSTSSCRRDAKWSTAPTAEQKLRDLSEHTDWPRSAGGPQTRFTHCYPDRLLVLCSKLTAPVEACSAHHPRSLYGTRLPDR